MGTCPAKAISSFVASALDVPFTDAVKVVSRWGPGAKDLVAAMENRARPVERGG